MWRNASGNTWPRQESYIAFMFRNVCVYKCEAMHTRVCERMYKTKVDVFLGQAPVYPLRQSLELG